MVHVFSSPLVNVHYCVIVGSWQKAYSWSISINFKHAMQTHTHTHMNTLAYEYTCIGIFKFCQHVVMYALRGLWFIQVA